MNFLNECFQSVDDLKNTDVVINGLNKEREELEKAIIRKNSNEEINDDDDIYSQIEAQSLEIADNLNLIVSDFLSNKSDLAKSSNEINLLLTTYGELALFNEIYEMLDKIQNLRNHQHVIEEYKIIYDQVVKLSSLDANDLDNVISFLSNLQSHLQRFILEAHEGDLKKDIVNNVKTQISTAIVEKFRPSIEQHITKDQAEPSTESLKKLVILQSLDPLNCNEKPLWFLKALTKSNLALKFKFHYDSNAETNMLNKPEWVFKFVQDWLSEHLDASNTKYSHVLKDTIYENESFKEQYIWTAVDLLKYKMAKNIKLIFKLPDDKSLSSNLIHLIEELLKNDNHFVNVFKVNINLVDSLILSNEEITSRWLEFEKFFNFQKFNSIISDKNAFQLDFESVDKWVTKPTNSSILIKNLLNNLNLKYELIKNLGFKLKLLTQIQLRILERYYERMEELLDAFNNLFKKFKILSSSKSEDEELIVGVKGVDRLLRIYCSLQYAIESMEEWNEDLLFIQLSKLIKEETFFNTLIRSYRELSFRVIKTIDEFLAKEINSSLKPYFKLSNWSSIRSFDKNVTLELNNGIKGLSNILEYFHKALSEIDLIPIMSIFEDKIVTFFNDSILHLNTFTYEGILQLQYDFTQTIETLKIFKNSKNYVKLHEIISFLTKVDKKLIRDLENSNYQKFREFCTDENLQYVKNEPDLLLSLARRRIF